MRFRIVTQLSTRRRQIDTRETQVGGAMEHTVLPRAVQVADPRRFEFRFIVNGCRSDIRAIVVQSCKAGLRAH